MLETSQEDKDSLKEIIQTGGFKVPDIKISIYKNRRGKYKRVLMWCWSNRGTCKINPMFVTDYQYKIVEVKDLKINVRPSAF